CKFSLGRICEIENLSVMAVSIAIFFDTRRIKKKTGTYLIKLRVTNEQITNYYPTIYSLSQEDYNKLYASRLNSELQEVRAKLQEIERTAKHAATELDSFSVYEFERDYIINNSLFEQKKYNTPVVPITRDYFDFHSGLYLAIPINNDIDCDEKPR